MENGDNLAQEFVEESMLPEVSMPALPSHDDFDSEVLNIGYYAPRIDPMSCGSDIKTRVGKNPRAGIRVLPEQGKHTGQKAYQCQGCRNNETGLYAA